MVIRFPLGCRDHLITLLNRCFVDPFSDSGLESTLAKENQVVDIVTSQSFHHAARNGAICVSVLALDSLIVILLWLRCLCDRSELAPAAAFSEFFA